MNTCIQLQGQFKPLSYRLTPCLLGLYELIQHTLKQLVPLISGALALGRLVVSNLQWRQGII